MNGKIFFSAYTCIIHLNIFPSTQNQNICLITDPSTENKNIIIKAGHQLTTLNAKLLSKKNQLDSSIYKIASMCKMKGSV